MIKLTKLRIGEFSQLMQVTVKTLRHYEQKGLLMPNEVDEWTGYRYTFEHNTEYTPTDIDIEYCEQIAETTTDGRNVLTDGVSNSIIQCKRIPAVPRALCMKHYGPYDRFYESFIEAFRYMDEHDMKIGGHPRISYVDGIWNEADPEKWLSIIQIPIE